MTSTLHCKIIPNDAIPADCEAVFDTTGRLLVAMTAPGFKLPETFEVEAEDGVVFTVVSEGEGHAIHEDDMDIFVPMVFG
ncbi:hypothetical protein P5704_026400 (plasmid) [Pseudomonas sp. FeN3W]|nr:hypothetical protein P5704_026400 [Pseudomonas sp. FeN3W]